MFQMTKSTFAALAGTTPSEDLPFAQLVFSGIGSPDLEIWNIEYDTLKILRELSELSKLSVRVWIGNILLSEPRIERARDRFIFQHRQIDAVRP